MGVTLHDSRNLDTGYDTVEGFKIGKDKIDPTALETVPSHLMIDTEGTANAEVRKP